MSVTAVPLQPVKSSYKTWLWFGVVVAIAAAFGLAWIGTGRQRALKGTNEQFLAWNKNQVGVHTTASGLEYQVIKPGDGPTASDGDVVIAEYEGSLRSGKIFDKGNPTQPTPFQVQENAYIPGFVEGLKLMQNGGVYRLWIPAKLGYGDKSPDPEHIPQNSLLVFKVNVQRLVDAATVRAMMQQRMQSVAPGGPNGGPPPGAEGQQAPPPQ